ncbi:MAG: DUF4960 domain-containing protein [Verrucomicrobia bacterium]|nr:DUF4960 domain-containing protein [Verrucomicrobiota bacterium]
MMKWSCCAILVTFLVAPCAGPVAAQPMQPRVAFLSDTENVGGLLDEEQEAHKFSAARLRLDTTVVTFDQLAKGEAVLDGYSMVWWHYARGLTLPPSALQPAALKAVRDYVDHGGNLLLSLQACQYIAALQIDVPPDQLAWQEKAAVQAVALRSKESNPVFGMLSERFMICPAGVLEPATFARWTKTQPKRGRLLAHAVIDGKDMPLLRSVYEWLPGKGRVVAIGEYGFRFLGPGGRQNVLNAQFAAGVFQAMCQPADYYLILRPKGRQIATPNLGYQSRITRGSMLFVEQGTPVEVEFIARPREQMRLALQVQFGRVDGNKWNRKDMVLLKEDVDFKPGKETRETGRFNTSVKPGEYYVVAWLGEDETPVYIQQLYVVDKGNPNSAAADRGYVYALEDAQWLVEVEKTSAALKGLTHKAYPGLNFAACEFNSPVADSTNPLLLGSFTVAWRAARGGNWIEESTFHSTDVRATALEGDKIVMRYDQPSQAAGGFKALRCVSTLSLNKALNCIEWQIDLRNAGQGAIELGSVRLPLAFNTSYAHMISTAEEIFDQRLVMRADVCGASTNVVLQPRSGDAPYLVLIPVPGTAFECLAHDQKANKPMGADWEGLPSLYIHSKALQETESWGQWVLGHSSTTLGPGDSRRYGVRLFLVRNAAEVDAVLYTQGRLLTHVSPGYVVPTDMPATLRLRCALGVGSVSADKGTTLEKLDDKGTVYSLKFTRTGHHIVRVTHGLGESTLLDFYAVPPLSELAAARSKYILANQRFTKADDARHGAFGMWDGDAKRIVDTTTEREASGGSGVTGIGPPLFVAAKNSVFPDAEEIAALEDYVQTCVLGRIQDTASGQVHAFLDKDGPGLTTNSYAYPPLFNLYYALYRIGRDYGLTHLPATDYLRFAFATAVGYLGTPMEPSTNRGLGNPGEATLMLITAALAREGLDEEAQELAKLIAAKVREVEARRAHAFGRFAKGRFWPADPGGLSGAYWIGRAGGSQPVLTRAVAALLATRGTGRHWMMYGCDLGWSNDLAKSPNDDQATLGHPGAWSGAALLDAAVLWRNPRCAELGYAALLAPWARVEGSGEPQGPYVWEPKLNRFDAYSGDVDMALAPTFFHLGAVVAVDASFGIVGYGCRVVSNQAAYSVAPADGLGKRVISVPHRLVIEVGADTIKKATVTMQADRLDVELASGWDKDHDGLFSVSGLQPGNWAVSLDGGPARSVTDGQLAAGIPIPFKGGKAATGITLAFRPAATQ